MFLCFFSPSLSWISVLTIESTRIHFTFKFVQPVKFEHIRLELDRQIDIDRWFESFHRDHAVDHREFERYRSNFLVEVVLFRCSKRWNNQFDRHQHWKTNRTISINYRNSSFQTLGFLFIHERKKILFYLNFYLTQLGINYKRNLKLIPQEANVVIIKETTECFLYEFENFLR